MLLGVDVGGTFTDAVLAFGLKAAAAQPINGP
jgi:N-methylhydantoinase A/oxoprolinase/acetone carboxylase beta subunit